MKNISIMAIFLLFSSYSVGYSQDNLVVPIGATMPNKLEIKTIDLNKDGKPDVTYYSDGKFVTKVEADTNYDGKPDVTIYTENGKFASAEVDTNYDGKVEQKFTDAKAFNKWLNENRPDFESQLNRPNWDVNLMQF